MSVAFELVDVSEELRGDLRDGNVVDVDVLLANEIEQEIEGAIVDLADGDGEGGLILSVFLLLLGASQGQPWRVFLSGRASR